MAWGKIDSRTAFGLARRAGTLPDGNVAVALGCSRLDQYPAGLLHSAHGAVGTSRTNEVLLIVLRKRRVSPMVVLPDGVAPARLSYSKHKAAKQSVVIGTAGKRWVAMRLAALWLVCSLCFGADLEALRNDHRWFDLREALKTQKGSALDRGAAAAAFQQMGEAERLLQTSPDNAARDLLFAMFMRNGLYQKATAVVRTRSSVAPGDRETIGTLSRLPDQSVVSRGTSPIQGQIRDSALFTPILVNGQRAKAQLDTDLNMSVVSQSEAQRLGLKIGAVTTGGASEEKGRGSVGIAEHFDIGWLRLRNVAFGIVSDDQQPFRDLPPGERVVLGQPVILAMGGFRWSRDGTIEIGTRAGIRIFASTKRIPS